MNPKNKRLKGILEKIEHRSGDVRYPIHARLDIRKSEPEYYHQKAARDHILDLRIGASVRCSDEHYKDHAAQNLERMILEELYSDILHLARNALNIAYSSRDEELMGLIHEMISIMRGEH